MKIGLISDYYTPFNPGGSEWSVYYLANSLKGNGIESIILTPNYGAKTQEIISGIKVLRLPMYKKTIQNRLVINPIWQNNPFFFLWSAFWIVIIARRERISLLHVHGKFLIPGAVMAGWFLRLPTVITIRDKQLICSYGKCFFEKGRYKGCGWGEYLTTEFKWYYNHYVKVKGIYSFMYNFLAAVWTRVAYIQIKFFTFHATKVTTISYSQKKYMEANGFKNVEMIYNSAVFPKESRISKRAGILFAGKLSLGKGVYSLLESIPILIKNRKEIFYFAGGVEEKEKINDRVKSLNIEKYTKFLGGVDHKKLQELYKKVKLVVIPSIYPESFGRVALEALSAGTPVVVSDIGGLPEILGKKKIGVITNTKPDSLSRSILKILNNLNTYLNNIQRERTHLIDKFEKKPIKQHIKLYNTLLSI